MPAPTVDIIVHGGQVVTSSEAYEASIAIKGEKIVAIGPEDLLPPADRHIDASGKYVLPGASIATSTLAAMTTISQVGSLPPMRA